LKTQDEEFLSKEKVSRTLTERARELNPSILTSKGTGKETPKGVFNTQNDETRQKNKKKCSNCNKKGHSFKECWAPGGGSEKTKGKGANVLGQLEEKEEEIPKIEVNKFAFSFYNMCNSWIIDSGATNHCINTKTFYRTFRSLDDSLGVGNGAKIKILGVGSIGLKSRLSDGTTTTIELKQVYYVPDLVMNLISTSELDSKGCSTLTKGGTCKIFDKENREFLSAKSSNGYWIVDAKPFLALA
jgi:hypothetical protein